MRVRSVGVFSIDIYSTTRDNDDAIVFGVIESGSSKYLIDGEQSKRLLELVNSLSLGKPEIKMATIEDEGDD
jgi:hypothetical protein